MTRGQICFLHEYCTDCPERKNCTVRPTFYSDEAYQKWKDQTIADASRVAKISGYNQQSIILGMNFGIKMMDKRRAKELELHPTYSPK